MEQTLELMRKRHAYYTKLIEEHRIHTAREFYTELRELFAMFGVDLYLDESESECCISITCEDYDYEDYTVVDGTDGNLASIKVTVEWKHPTYMCHDKVDIFADEKRKEYVSTGFSEIDALIGGCKKPSLTLLCGRPKMGKSTMCYNMAFNIATRGIKVALFSLSDSADRIVTLMLSNVSLIPMEILRQGTLTKRHWKILNREKCKLESIPFYIDDTPAISPSMLHRKIVKLKIEHGIDIVFIDYLELMSADSKLDTREEEILDILTKLNAMSQQMSIPIVVLSQLNKVPKVKGRYRPELSSVHFDTSIPSNILFLYRPDSYDPQKRKNRSQPELVEFIVAKSQCDWKGAIPLKFYPDYCRFEQLK